MVDARLAGNEIRDLSATFAHDEIWATLTMNFNASVSEWKLPRSSGSEAVAAMDVFRDLLVVVPNDQDHTARERASSSAAMLGGHVARLCDVRPSMERRRLSYGNDEVVTRFVDAVQGDRERLRWMTADDGCAVVTCLEELVAARCRTEPG